MNSFLVFNTAYIVKIKERKQEDLLHPHFVNIMLYGRHPS